MGLQRLQGCKEVDTRLTDFNFLEYKREINNEQSRKSDQLLEILNTRDQMDKDENFFLIKNLGFLFLKFYLTLFLNIYLFGCSRS